MELEDHAGDVLAKARAGIGVSVEEAAGLAEVDEAEYRRFERDGTPGEAMNLRSVSERLGLDGRRLEALIKGWRPQEQDLTRWRELRRITTTSGMSVNSYLVWDEVTREAALFDTGWDAAPVVALVETERLTLRHLFITHTHHDHVAALTALRERFPKAKLHTNSAQAPVEHRNRPNDFISLGSLRITNRATPGHAEDGVTYVIGNWPDDAPHVAVVGDAVFAGSMGKASGQLNLARQKVRDQIFSLPPETLICPGHGPVSTVVEEAAHNPFFGS